MADVTAIVSENTAIRYQAAMHSLEMGATLLPYEIEALQTLAYAIREGLQANQLRERLAELEEHNEP